MKRSAALTPLSHDHHHGLVLVRDIRTALASAEPDLDALRAQVACTDRDALVPHFETEEQFLGEPLRAHGETDAVGELLRQHRDLRALLDAADSLDREQLADLAAKLTDHIRWEERDFFPLAEHVLDAATLAAAGEAARDTD